MGFDSKGSPGPRRSAVEILSKVDAQGAYADILLDARLTKSSLAPRDRALLTELVYGTLRWRGTIDYYLGFFLKRPIERMNPNLRNVLRVAIYQLLFLDRVPDYAVVNESVESAKRYGGKTASLVNGILREFLRRQKNLVLPDASADLVRHLSARWSHPDWLVKRWLSYFDQEQVEGLLRANNEAAPVILRANLRQGGRAGLMDKLRQAGIEARPTEFSPQGVRIASGASLNEMPGWKEGSFIVQGEASQLVGYLLGAQPGERILDACATPGGKTTHVAELMDDRGEVIATDISARGLEKLKQNMQRLGLSSIRPFFVDVTRGFSGPLAQPYDRILIDAPCTGLGTLRSHPEGKWRRCEEDIVRLSRLQKKIITKVASYLRPGGTMVYATCTMAVEENEWLVEDFLNGAADFVLEAAGSYLPSGAERLTRGNYLVTLPDRDNTDGFFAARLKKAT